jgi:hypothetical protein
MILEMDAIHEAILSNSIPIPSDLVSANRQANEVATQTAVNLDSLHQSNRPLGKD